MDIKSLVRSVIPFTSTAQAAQAKRRAETGSTTDRDANGKQEQSSEQPRRNLTPEELKQVIQYLEGLQGVKENQLRVRLECQNQINIVYVEDTAGNIVRRIPEADLAVILNNQKQVEPKKSGNLLNRSA